MKRDEKWLRMRPQTIRATLNLSRRLVQMSADGECLSRRLGLYKVLETPLRQQQELLALLFTCATSGRQSERIEQIVAAELMELPRHTHRYAAAVKRRDNVEKFQKKVKKYHQTITEVRKDNTNRLGPIEVFSKDK